MTDESAIVTTREEINEYLTEKEFFIIIKYLNERFNIFVPGVVDNVELLSQLYKKFTLNKQLIFNEVTFYGNEVCQKEGPCQLLPKEKGRQKGVIFVCAEERYYIKIMDKSKIDDYILCDVKLNTLLSELIPSEIYHKYEFKEYDLESSSFHQIVSCSSEVFQSLEGQSISMNLQEYLKIPGNFDTFYANIINYPEKYKNFWQIIFYSVLNNLSDIRAENIVINSEHPEKMTIIDRVLLHFENYMLHIMHDTEWQHISFLDFLLINFIALNKFYLYNFGNGKELYEEDLLRKIVYKILEMDSKDKVDLMSKLKSIFKECLQLTKDKCSQILEKMSSLSLPLINLVVDGSLYTKHSEYLNFEHLCHVVDNSMKLLEYTDKKEDGKCKHNNIKIQIKFGINGLFPDESEIKYFSKKDIQRRFNYFYSFILRYSDVDISVHNKEPSGSNYFSDEDIEMIACEQDTWKIYDKLFYLICEYNMGGPIRISSYQVQPGVIKKIPHLGVQQDLSSLQIFLAYSFIAKRYSTGVLITDELYQYLEIEHLREQIQKLETQIQELYLSTKVVFGCLGDNSTYSPDTSSSSGASPMDFVSFNSLNLPASPELNIRSTGADQTLSIKSLQKEYENLEEQIKVLPKQFPILDYLYKCCIILPIRVELLDKKLIQQLETQIPQLETRISQLETRIQKLCFVTNVVADSLTFSSRTSPSPETSSLPETSFSLSMSPMEVELFNLPNSPLSPESQELNCNTNTGSADADQTLSIKSLQEKNIQLQEKIKVLRNWLPELKSLGDDPSLYKSQKSKQSLNKTECVYLNK